MKDTMVNLLTINLKYVVLEFSFYLKRIFKFLNKLSKYELGYQAIRDQICYLNNI